MNIISLQLSKIKIKIKSQIYIQVLIHMEIALQNQIIIEKRSIHANLLVCSIFIRKQIKTNSEKEILIVCSILKPYNIFVKLERIELEMREKN